MRSEESGGFAAGEERRAKSKELLLRGLQLVGEQLACSRWGLNRAEASSAPTAARRGLRRIACRVWRFTSCVSPLASCVSRLDDVAALLAVHASGVDDEVGVLEDHRVVH